MENKTLEYALLVMKKLRVERGLTQQDLAVALEYQTGKGYSDIENGRRKLCLEHLEKLAKFYQVPIAIFFEENSTEMVQYA